MLPVERWNRVRQRWHDACTRAGRAVDEVKLLTVTKQRAVADILPLYGLGLRLFGENRVAEAQEKQAALAGDIEWHMIGHLQSNKAKDCLGFSWLHSLDRLETARALEKVFARAGKTLNVLLEVNTGGEEQKDGVAGTDDLLRLVESWNFPHLVPRGLMTMAPFTRDESVVRPCFATLRGHRDTLRSEFPQFSWDELSMGMTNDYEWAIEEGSTIIRIGTALFEGER